MLDIGQIITMKGQSWQIDDISYDSNIVIVRNCSTNEIDYHSVEFILEQISNTSTKQESFNTDIPGSDDVKRKMYQMVKSNEVELGKAFLPGTSGVIKAVSPVENDTRQQSLEEAIAKISTNLGAIKNSTDSQEVENLKNKQSLLEMELNILRKSLSETQNELHVAKERKNDVETENDLLRRELEDVLLQSSKTQSVQKPQSRVQRLSELEKQILDF